MDRGTLDMKPWAVVMDRCRGSKGGLRPAYLPGHAQGVLGRDFDSSLRNSFCQWRSDCRAPEPPGKVRTDRAVRKSWSVFAGRRSKFTILWIR